MEGIIQQVSFDSRMPPWNSLIIIVLYVFQCICDWVFFSPIFVCRVSIHDPCGKRRSKTEYETLFPAIDFSLASNFPCLRFYIWESTTYCIRTACVILVLPLTCVCSFLTCKISELQIENDEDILWKEDLRETDEELAKREEWNSWIGIICSWFQISVLLHSALLNIF